jgi:hypothetical protein
MGEIEGRDEEYERSVLNFLDQELSELQLKKKPDVQSSELDSLVNSLLEQVISESDMKGNVPAQPESVKAMLAEFPPDPKPIADDNPPEPEIESAQPTINTGQAGALFKTSASLRTNKGRLPVVVIALISALGIIGAIAYYLSISQ